MNKNNDGVYKQGITTARRNIPEYNDNHEITCFYYSLLHLKNLQSVFLTFLLKIDILPNIVRYDILRRQNVIRLPKNKTVREMKSLYVRSALTTGGGTAVFIQRTNLVVKMLIFLFLLF